VRAARLWGAVAAQHRTRDLPLDPSERAPYDRGSAAAECQPDRETFAAAWAEGQAMTTEQAIAYALEESGPDVDDQASVAIP
jgi:ferric-dicitrate binding protein FerR (iron transport regulator)